MQLTAYANLKVGEIAQQNIVDTVTFKLRQINGCIIFNKVMNKSVPFTLSAAAAGTTCISNFMNDGGKPKGLDTSTGLKK